MWKFVSIINVNAAEVFKFLTNWTFFKLNSVIRKTRKWKVVPYDTDVDHPILIPQTFYAIVFPAAVDTTFSASRRRPPARQCARDRDVVRMPFPCTVMAAPVARRYDDAAQRGDPSRPWTAYRRPAAQVWVSYPLLAGKSLFFSCFFFCSEVVASISD